MAGRYLIVVWIVDLIAEVQQKAIDVGVAGRERNGLPHGVVESATIEAEVRA
jgi:hypothetical protein